MARYFFHLKNSVDVLLDPDGVEMAADDVPAAALKAARDCIAEDVKEGRLDLHFRIDIHDEDGKVVHSLRFEDALEEVRDQAAE